MIEDFDVWYDILKTMARKHGENVSDRSAWREEFDAGKYPEEAFYEEYPEHKGEKQNG